jgi:hypothetical protein
MGDVNGGTLLVLSQDYELFFGTSGSAEKCLFEPCAALTAFARERDVHFTFYVDAGMLVAMRRYSAKSPRLQREYDAVRHHIAELARAGHEIGLHVHPHWQDTRWTDAGWDFSGTRYQLRDFSDDEALDVIKSNAAALQDLGDGQITSYRAGGFCVESFSRIAPMLAELGITIDSSVVPGARLDDVAKGFDFSAAPDMPSWRFDESPVLPSENGRFVEVAITPLVLPVTHYWGRLVDRLKPGPSAASMGDGVSKAIGKREILRRLLGAARVSELSVDAAKAHHLSTSRVQEQRRPAWHVMGHPKLLGRESFDHLDHLIHGAGINNIMTVSEFARRSANISI